LYLATFTMGFMGFHVFGPDVPQDVHGDLVYVVEVPSLDPEGVAQTLLTRIWPDAPVFRWPPAKHANIEDLPSIAYWPRSAQGLNHPPDPGYRRTDGFSDAHLN
jgi:hypothetical protein